jgi:hypothetical protein
MVVPHASLARFLRITGHPPRILDVDDNGAASPPAGAAASNATGLEKADPRVPTTGEAGGIFAPT